MDFSLLDYHLSLFYTEMSVFSCESCQCAGKYGFWNLRSVEDLDVLTVYIVFACGCYLPLSGTVHNVSGFFLVEISYRMNPTVLMD